jgi:tetrahydromethanopterin S-methyltransferase subunit G
MPAMNDTPDNLVLVYLHRLDEKTDRPADDMRDVKARLTSLEGRVALLHGDFAGQSERIDRLEIRLDRIEKRLDIVTA